MTEQWIEVFRAGKHTDSSGNEREWTEQDLDTIVGKYNPAEFEAPVVIGHPETNDPAWGWVESIKREGAVLLAKLKDLVPEFVEMLQRKMFKNRSISLYPDLSLRHIGFLGAVPPAVKGLRGIQFDNSKPEYITFQIKETNDMSEDLKAQLAEKDAQIKEFSDKLKEASAEVKDLKKQLTEAGKASKEAQDFAEKIEKLEEANKALNGQLDAMRKERRETEHTLFCDGLVESGKLTPAQVPYAMRILDLLGENTAEHEFTEGDKKVKKTAVTAFKDLLSGMAEQIEFTEIARKGEAEQGSASIKIEKLVTEKLKADKSLTYSEALRAVQVENPDLAKAMALEVR